MIDVKNRWALITGASRGIGYQAAMFMAKQGCNLILHSRSLESTQTLLSEIETMGAKAYAVAAELSDPDQVRRMLGQIDDLGVDVDIILNNAGLQIAYREEYFLTPPEDFSESFKTNTIAPMMICYHFLPKMIQRDFGRIVNTTSGIRLEPEQAGYSASKAALDKVTVDLGSTLQGTDVMLNLTDPGWCRTDLGGPNAPNPPESVIPGVVVGVFASDKKSGRIFPAQAFTGRSLEDAVDFAEKTFDSPC